jgi:hypothetical protein
VSQRESGYERKERDLYETPAWVTLALIRHLPGRLRPGMNVYEPAAGTPRFNKTGFRGVGQFKDGRFFSQPAFRGKRYFLGIFDTAAEASAAYIQFRKQKDGAFFADPNRVPVTNKSENAEHEPART